MHIRSFLHRNLMLQSHSFCMWRKKLLFFFWSLQSPQLITGKKNIETHSFFIVIIMIMIFFFNPNPNPALHCSLNSWHSPAHSHSLSRLWSWSAERSTSSSVPPGSAAVTKHPVEGSRGNAQKEGRGQAEEIGVNVKTHREALHRWLSSICQIAFEFNGLKLEKYFNVSSITLYPPGFWLF